MPETQVAGKFGYSVMPMGHSLHNAGYCLGVSADSKNKEAAYLFTQWMTSPSISLERVILPYALRDPYRLSHYASEEYRSRWASAGTYLDTLKAAADTALLDIVMPGSSEYQTALDDVVTSAQVAPRSPMRSLPAMTHSTQSPTELAAMRRSRPTPTSWRLRVVLHVGTRRPPTVSSLPPPAFEAHMVAGGCPPATVELPVSVPLDNALPHRRWHSRRREVRLYGTVACRWPRDDVATGG